MPSRWQRAPINPEMVAGLGLRYVTVLRVRGLEKRQGRKGTAAGMHPAKQKLRPTSWERDSGPVQGPFSRVKLAKGSGGKGGLQVSLKLPSFQISGRPRFRPRPASRESDSVLLGTRIEKRRHRLPRQLRSSKIR